MMKTAHLTTPYKAELSKWRLSRRGELDLEFQGWMISTASTSFDNQTFTTNIYQTKSGKFVFEYLRFYEDTKTTTSKVDVFEDVKQLFRWLVDVDEKGKSRYIGTNRLAWIGTVRELSLNDSYLVQVLE